MGPHGLFPKYPVVCYGTQFKASAGGETKESQVTFLLENETAPKDIPFHLKTAGREQLTSVSVSFHNL